MVKSYSQLIGIIGLVLLVFGQIVWFVAPQDTYYLFPVQSGLGAAFLVISLFTGGILERFKTVERRTASHLADLLYIALFAIFLVVLNVVAARNNFFRVDTTEAKVFTLADETLEVLSKVNAPLKVRAFFLGGIIEDAKVRDLLSRLERTSKQVSLQVIDPEKDLKAIEKFGISETGTLHLAYELPGETRIAKVTKSVNEEELLTALKKVVSGPTRKVYYLSGHGEPVLADKTARDGYLFAQEAIQGENLSLLPLDITGGGDIPQDAALLLVASGERPILPTEKTAIEQYLSRGGNGVFLVEPTAGNELRELLTPLGVRVGRDIVLDQMIQVLGGGALGVDTVVKTFADHPLTKGFTKGVLFTTACSVMSSAPTAVELAFSSNAGWAERNIEELLSSGRAAKDSEDEAGPVSIAAALEKVEGKHGRVVVFGDNDFAKNARIGQLYNREFFLRAITWAVGDELRTSLSAKTMRASREPITADNFSRAFSISAIIFPELILLLGFGVWWSRRGS